MTTDGVGTVGDLSASDESVDSRSTRDSERDRALVLNPVSGDGKHQEQVRGLADEYGFTILETQREGEAIEFGRLLGEAGTDLVAAAGGDGTLNEVARGLDAANALEGTTFGVVPTGTGNNFAQNVGVESVEHAFEVLERGDRHRIDLGTGDDWLFLNSCVAGVTAEASASTTPEMKDRLGVLAYVITGLRTVTEFDGLPLSVEALGPEGGDTWTGDAVTVLVGNARRFPAEGRSQANCEDGLLDVTIVEQMPPRNLLEEAAVQRLFGDETEHVTHLEAAKLQLDVRQEDPIGFSFDGEIGNYSSLSLGTRPKTLNLCVGETYESDPL
ncbi:diacylglycerol/lipid kinase family protein [Halorussus halophilus]|uniref:diacylglycerol/lipid kinase family protein n=1 Tax=Halorussus halophilus TaxID=2650975 RepID=UPI00130177B9|nr:diacylglycerol kinase family protein [Halorussus halophilus]